MRKVEIPEELQNFNEGKVSDDEDNSWADIISESDKNFPIDDPNNPNEGTLTPIELAESEDDDYYGEQEDDDDEYGDQWVKKRRRASKHAGKYHNIDRFFYDRRNHNRIIMNSYCTEYDVVKKSARKIAKFKVIEVIENPDGGTQKRGGKLSPVWDISWHDLAITPDFLAKMEPY